MQILREWHALDVKLDKLNEDMEKSGGKIFLTGIIQKAEAINHNKRIYPFGILQREVENYQKAVRENRAMGECDHPESVTVALSNVSHIVREMWWEGRDLMGKIEILPTPRGKVLETLIRAGVQLGVSSRGVGSTQQNEGGASIVQPDFQLVCFDMVSEPSTPGAYPTPMMEGKNITLPKLSKQDRIFRALNAIVLGDRKEV